MFDVFAIAALAAVLFVELIVVCLCFAYLLDYFVRLATNDRYEVISKRKKG
jgi:hypothetical protein